LRARLLDEQPELIDELHRRAAWWYEQHGYRPDAIRHAMAGKDFERAAELIELALPALRQARELTTIRGWLRALPESLYENRPVLSVTYAGALMANGEMDDVESLLRDAERWLDTAGETGVAVADKDAFHRLPATIAIYRAAQARAASDVAGATIHAQRALELAGENDHFERGAAAGFLALAHWGSGELEAAFGAWTETMASLRQAGHLVDAVGCIRPLAEIRMAQGRLGEAMRLYEQGWRLANEQDAPVLRGAADMQVGMSTIRFERGDLAAARQHLAKSNELGEHSGLALNPYRWRLAMARITAAEGDHEGALVLLDEAERVYVSEFYPDVRPVGAIRARIWISQGRLGEATAWLSDRALSVDDELSYLREFEHITVARLLMARFRLDTDENSYRDAVPLLGRLLTAAEEGGRTHGVIEVLVLQALAHQMSGDAAGALEPLRRALSLAEPEGYIQVFAGEGAAIAPLLSAAGKEGVAPGYVGRLLSHVAGTDFRSAPRQALVEPLSERELHVLRLLASDLDGPGIAGELVVALSTVRSHTKSIYAKLGVNSRRAAVSRGDELGLLSRAARG
jgi:LuxR family maltose regulon positive regulatory protein